MTEDRLRKLLQPFLIAPDTQGGAAEHAFPDGLYGKLLVYLDLLVRWNEKTNLTSIRNPEEMVTRHFGESLFTALRLLPYVGSGSTLLDVGSGAGFPGLPIQLALPDLAVTLAESQGKKASFLREVVRTLGVTTEIWPGRTEALPKGRRFDFVTLRAVDKMEYARGCAIDRLVPGGILAELGGEGIASSRGLLLRENFLLGPGAEKRFLGLWAHA